jgi:hypothetical protein
VASNQLGSGNTPGQSCVYAPQIGSLVVTATSAKFAIGPALLKRGADDRGNVMEPAMAADKLRASNHFTAVATHTAPDIANSRSRQLPFCPISRPEPFPTFLLTPKPAYRGTWADWCDTHWPSLQYLVQCGWPA